MRAAPARATGERNSTPDESHTGRPQKGGEPPSAHVSFEHQIYESGAAVRLTASMTSELQRVSGNATVSRLVVQRDALPLAETFQPARDISSYIQLVRALERSYPEKSPREILAMLRQMYYGRPWSVDPAEQWRDVLPGSPQAGDPRRRLGSGRGTLLDALRQSQNTIAGLDIAHVFAGLEALLNPTSSVEIEVTGPNPVVNMPNTEFATWGGDLGSAAGQALADPDIGERQRSDQEYFADKASPDDLEGDIDAYGIVRGAGGRGGLASLLNTADLPGGGTPVSLILAQYYGPATSSRLGGAHRDRYRDFATAIGAQVQGDRITNMPALVPAIATRVGSFAHVWYWKEYKRVHGTLQTMAAYASRDPVIQIMAYVKSVSITRLFLNWLQSRLGSA